MTDQPTAKQSYWLNHIRTAQQNGLSYTDYAKEHHLNLKALYSWSSILRRHGLLDRPASAFVEVKARPNDSSLAKVTEPRSAATAILPNGIKLELPSLCEQTIKWLSSL